MVRTPGFHPGNRGSTPLGTTDIRNIQTTVRIFFVFAIKKSPSAAETIIFGRFINLSFLWRANFLEENPGVVSY